jgi:hypothetical protein
MSFVAVTLLFVGIVGLVVTHRRAGTRLDRTLAEAARSYVPRRRTSEAVVVRDLETIALKIRAGEPLSRRDRRRAAALVRALEDDLFR